MRSNSTFNFQLSTFSGGLRRAFAVALLLLPLCCHAVLKEKDLAGTLVILRSELTAAYQENELRSQNYRRNNKAAEANMSDILRRSEQNALMLYSQKKDYVFDLAYACHEATELYKNFKSKTQPFKKFADKTAFERARYDSLVSTLHDIPDELLDSASLRNKAVCLSIAAKLGKQLQDRDRRMRERMRQYNALDKRLSDLNNYANQRYAEIQHNIFRNGGSDYLTLLKSFTVNLLELEEAFNDKYRSYSVNRSEWDVRVMGYLFMSIFFYAIVAFLLNFLAYRFLLPKRLRTPWFMERRGSVMTATTVITFAIAVSVIMRLYRQNFLAMAGELLVQYSWLIGVIILSVLGRVKPAQLRSAYRLYSPLITVSFIVIVFRIILIPNILVNLIFPPIILICAAAQWYVLKRDGRDVPVSDLRFTQISQLAFIFSIVSSFVGFTLLAVQALIWWTMQLTFILTISCIRSWISAYEEKKSVHSQPINQAWTFYLMDDVVVPILSIASVLISVYWAADVFNLSDTVMRFFDHNFIDEDNFRLSMMSLSIIASMWFVCSFISRLCIAIARENFIATDPGSADSRAVMIRNVVQVVVWGAWFIVSLVIMRVNTTWLAIIGGGLSTGVGFASRGIIENIYYGISLMTGRIKIGDLIECDGTRGKVSSISYTSTLIEAVDGSIIAFQNSQLFTKNYKNLTRNHGYVLSKVDFSVAYGSKPSEITEIITAAVSHTAIDGMDADKPPTIVLGALADSSVNFTLITWVDVTKQGLVESQLRTLIYDTLTERGVEIPFPQMDVHLRKE